MSIPSKATGPSLTVRGRDGTSRSVPLTTQPISIGRAANCDVVLRDDGGVSREHAQVWLDDMGRVMVADLGSKNGTRVDAGEMFRETARVATRSIRIGEYELELDGLVPPGPSDETEVRFAPDAPSTVGDTKFFPSSKRLDLNQRRLTLLMDLTERIGGAFERKQLLEQALDACCESLGFERGLIALKTPRGEPELPVTRNVQRDETGAFKISRTLINKALIHGERAVVNNAATDLVDNLSESLVRFPIRSALCVPILHREEILGVIYGDRVTQASTYAPGDVDFLAAIAQQVGVGLENLRLFREHLRAQKVYQELDQARTIQCGLLPARPIQIGCIELAGYNEPSSAVGGDYFDHYDLGGGRAGLIIADVTGHGLPAALMMANFQAAVRVSLTADCPLPHVAQRLNELVCRNSGTSVFITAIIGRVDTTSGAIEFVSAGHPGPILVGKGVADALEPENSLPFGIEIDDTYDVHRVQLDDRVRTAVFYTDGLIEAENEADELCGLSPIVASLGATPDPAPEEAIHTALETVRKHVGNARIADDVTLLVARYRR